MRFFIANIIVILSIRNKSRNKRNKSANYWLSLCGDRFRYICLRHLSEYKVIQDLWWCLPKIYRASCALMEKRDYVHDPVRVDLLFVLLIKAGLLAQPKNKKTETHVSVFLCGERGIRTPGPVTVNSFQDCRNRPLCHFSN